MVDDRMLGFVKDFIEQHDPIATKLTTRFPFRRLYEHCWRCYRWAQRISRLEGGDREVAEVSALFHDIGKCVDNTRLGHAERGAEICKGYLDQLEIDPAREDHIVRIVREHIHHAREGETSLEAKIESDADLLDEAGAVTVLWDCMALGAEDDPSYEAAYQRIRQAHDKLRSSPLDRFQTAAGRRFAQERLAFLGEFVLNLEFELGLSGAPLDHLEPRRRATEG